VLVTYRYKLKPTRGQYARLAKLCEGQRQLYNAALQERIESYKVAKRNASLKGRDRPIASRMENSKLIPGDFTTLRGAPISYMDQCKSLTEIRHADIPDVGDVPPNMGRWTLKRVDAAFNGLFQRMKAGKAAGFPRYRAKSRWRSFGFNEFSGITLKADKLRFKGIDGALRVNLHRPIPDGAKIKTAQFTRHDRSWFVTLVIDVAATEWHANSGSSIGIDIGIENLATLSNGEVFANARPRSKHERQLRIAQRALARCKRTSRRRQQVRQKLARIHQRIANARTTHLHQVSANITRRFEVIAVEDLKLKNMTRSAQGTLAEPGTNVAAKSGLNRSLLDAAPGRLVSMLRYKAERAGGGLRMVDPRNTSQDCSFCGTKVPKKLAARQHSCSCGANLHRDHNAARNILARAVQGP
jgi:putative transposase